MRAITRTVVPAYTPRRGFECLYLRHAVLSAGNSVVCAPGNHAKSPPIRVFSLSNWTGENIHPEASAAFWGSFLCWADRQSGFVSRTRRMEDDHNTIIRRKRT